MTFNRQQAFEKMVRGLYQQNRLSRSAALAARTLGGCKYRHHEGWRCAIGFLIPDSKYKPEMEGSPCQPADTAIWRFLADELGCNQDDGHFLAVAQQRLHDRLQIDTWLSFRDALEIAAIGLAATYSLNAGFVTELEEQTDVV